jgi:formate dehydrogenase major subunit
MGDRAVIWDRPYQEPPESPDEEYPMWLTTGRVLEHWHTGSMTRRSYVLDAVNPEPIVQMSSRDILKLGIKHGDMVRIASRRGDIEIMVREDNQVPPGAVFIPFAFVEAAANELTNPKLDPFGKIPEFKFCAVKVEPAAAGHMEAAE